jgi:Right handed beta helix region
MKRLAIPSAIVAAAFASFLSASPAFAQATSTWVSGVGDDVNPCSRTAPCKTFAGAISKTAVNGEIRCLDPGGFGAVTITKSITIECHEILASILASGTTGVIINITAVTDALKTVRLRNLIINGTGNGARSGIHGVNILAANAVYLDDLRIDGFTQFGVRDNRTGNGTLYIRNSIVRDNAGTAIAVFPASGIVGAVIENSTGEGSNFGLSAGPNSKVVVKRSVFSGNVTGGVNADNTSQLSIDDSAISNNTGVGISANAGSTVRISNNDIALNGGNALNGATTTFGNNRIYPTVGTAPTAAVPGQQ